MTQPAWTNNMPPIPVSGMWPVRWPAAGPRPVMPVICGVYIPFGPLGHVAALLPPEGDHAPYSNSQCVQANITFLTMGRLYANFAGASIDAYLQANRRAWDNGYRETTNPGLHGGGSHFIAADPQSVSGLWTQLQAPTIRPPGTWASTSTVTSASDISRYILPSMIPSEELARLEAGKIAADMIEKVFGAAKVCIGALRNHVPSDVLQHGAYYALRQMARVRDFAFGIRAFAPEGDDAKLILWRNQLVASGLRAMQGLDVTPVVNTEAENPTTYDTPNYSAVLEKLCYDCHSAACAVRSSPVNVDREAIVRLSAGYALSIISQTQEGVGDFETALRAKGVGLSTSSSSEGATLYIMVTDHEAPRTAQQAERLFLGVQAAYLSQGPFIRVVAQGGTAAEPVVSLAAQRLGVVPTVIEASWSVGKAAAHQRNHRMLRMFSADERSSLVVFGDVPDAWSTALAKVAGGRAPLVMQMNDG